MPDFKKKPFYFTRDRVLYISVPFTWNLRGVRERLLQRGFFWDHAIVGGPAVYLLPHYFSDLEFVTVGRDLPGILQMINPMATKTTVGCIRCCPFCVVPRIEGRLQELDDWPDLPILIDNNLLAASSKHFDRVVERLVRWGWCDFNQGLDARLLTDYHAERLARIRRPIIRLAMDNINEAGAWVAAVERLTRAGVRKKSIRSLALIAFDSDPDEAWLRCRLIESYGIKPSPQWYHSLDATRHNATTSDQVALGWNDYERRRIMQWFYKHKIARRP